LVALVVVGTDSGAIESSYACCSEHDNTEAAYIATASLMVDCMRIALKAIVATHRLDPRAFSDGGVRVGGIVVARHGLRAGDGHEEQRYRRQKRQQSSCPPNCKPHFDHVPVQTSSHNLRQFIPFFEFNIDPDQCGALGASRLHLRPEENAVGRSHRGGPRARPMSKELDVARDEVVDEIQHAGEVIASDLSEASSQMMIEASLAHRDL
jgi:hypothetical protein